MLKTLLKMNFEGMFSSLFGGKGQKKKISTGQKALVVILLIYVVAYLGFMAVLFFGDLANTLAGTSLEWLYFSLAAIIAFLMSFIGTAFYCQRQLFEAKDNDLLLSLPVKPVYILAGRILSIFAISFVFQTIFLLPAGILFLIRYGGTTLGIISFIILWLSATFLSMTFSCFFGWLFALISSKVRKKNVIQMILFIGLLALYFFVVGQADHLVEYIISNGATIGEAVEKFLFPFYHFGVAIASGGNVVSMLLFLLCAGVPFAAVYMLLSKSFINIATANRGAKKIKYVKKELKTSGQTAALVKKELRHFTSSAMYMMNAGVGLLFILVIAIGIIVKLSDLQLLLIQVPNMISAAPAIVSAAFVGCCTMIIISAPSISVEGKNLWISQSLPLEGKTIVLSKAYAQMVVTAPFLFVSGIATAVCLGMLGCDVSGILCVLIVPQCYNVFQSLFGVTINLRFPKQDYASDVAAVKQSMATAVSMFGSMGIIVIAIALFMGLGVMQKVNGPVIFMYCFGLVMAALSALLYVRILKKGNVLFEKVGQ